MPRIIARTSRRDRELNPFDKPAVRALGSPLASLLAGAIEPKLNVKVPREPFVPRSSLTSATSVQNTFCPNGCAECFSKFQFNGVGGLRTYIGFTHSASP